MKGNSIISQLSNGRQISFCFLKKIKQIYKVIVPVTASQGEEGVQQNADPLLSLEITSLQSFLAGFTEW